MSRKTFKKGRSSPFIQLHHWVCDSPAWQSLKPGPKVLYIELKRRFNGGNNGEIFLSHREAAKALNVGRDTVARYYSDLQDRGFILQTKGHCLGPSGIGQATKWALTEHRLNEAPATKDFMRWQKQKSRRKTQRSLAGKSGTPCREIQHSGSQKSENPAAFGVFEPKSVLDNPAIYTFSHVPKVPDLSVKAGLNLCDLLRELVATDTPDQSPQPRDWGQQ